MFQDHLRHIRFIKKESFKPSLKGGKGVCYPEIYCQLIPQERGLITEGSASHSTFRNSGNHKETCSLGAKYSVWKISYNEIFKIWWSSVIKSFICEEKNLKFYSKFNWGQWSEAKTGETWSLLLVLIRTLAAAFWISWRLFREYVGQPNNKELQ